jgi:hypothetical protein
MSKLQEYTTQELKVELAIRALENGGLRKLRERQIGK